MSQSPSLSSSSLLANSSLPPNSLFYLFNNSSSSFTSTSQSQQQQQLQQQQQQQTGSSTTPTSLNVPATSTITASTTPTAGATATAVNAPLSTSSTIPITSSATLNTDTHLQDDKECGNILMEIDKGIRSGNLGDQVESIVFFGYLIRYHPTPLLITSVIVKLSDIFRNTNNNLVKHRILKVFQECNREIHKITNIDEILRRIHSVIQSNDPVARSLALRVLGSIPHLIVDKLYIHHSIRQCMQSSHDQVEVEATIFIMDRLCEISPLFSNSVIESINSLIQRVETPPITKLKYTRLFRHMHHNQSISNQSKEMLIELLELYPSVIFVTVILDTLTTLTSKHILSIDNHILFLKKYIKEDPRQKVKITALKCLQRLAIVSPHSSYPIREIFQTLKETSQSYKEIKFHSLYLISLLSSIHYQSIIDDSEGVQLLNQYSLHHNLQIAQLSINILTNLVIEGGLKQSPIESQLVQSICRQEPGDLWCCYQLAQQAQKHGFHLLAMVIYHQLLGRVESVCNHFWLKGLLSIAKLEHSISESDSFALTSYIASYHPALICLKSSSLSERSLIFQEEFLKLREKWSKK
eukprot:gene10251-12571_t